MLPCAVEHNSTRWHIDSHCECFRSKQHSHKATREENFYNLLTMRRSPPVWTPIPCRSSFSINVTCGKSRSLSLSRKMAFWQNTWILPSPWLLSSPYFAELWLSPCKLFRERKNNDGQKVIYLEHMYETCPLALVCTAASFPIPLRPPPAPFAGPYPYRHGQLADWAALFFAELV